MNAGGFRGYAREWWHFTYAATGAAAPQGFPIPRRPG
jgi:D-alanyl-D-alanine dipeptidase